MAQLVEQRIRNAWVEGRVPFEACENPGFSTGIFCLIDSGMNGTCADLCFSIY